ncbi:hypothetical protein CHS0354_030441 [Potamilus streckersoni]|uniref:Peptidase C14A caspase catalytic domain-containing protein n=1 Tax=Potamilus streckersoni TaxID=2493646 RepID=A0AAE0SHZ0_9BIVA|nr:hypothetical protein CHS0354_030441 [Potamilus streckersoni]
MAQATEDTPRESATPYITKEQYESRDYTWRKDKKSKVLFFQFNKCRNKEGKKYERRTSEWEEHDLKKCFKNLVGGVDFKAYRNRKVTELPAIFDNEFQDDKRNMDYNCFIFILLSVGENDRIFCYDNEITITNFIEPIKRKQSMALKPKLFFIQNGDERLIGTVRGEVVKGKPLEFEHRKVPQEADFFIMQSIIPESLFLDPKFSDTFECIFMKDLIETVKDEKQNPGEKPLDIHQLSIRINARVNKRLMSKVPKSDTPMYYDRLPIPEVTSTLTKALCFPC